MDTAGSSAATPTTTIGWCPTECGFLAAATKWLWQQVAAEVKNVDIVREYANECGGGSFLITRGERMNVIHDEDRLVWYLVVWGCAMCCVWLHRGCAGHCDDASEKRRESSREGKREKNKSNKNVGRVICCMALSYIALLSRDNCQVQLGRLEDLEVSISHLLVETPLD